MDPLYVDGAVWIVCSGYCIYSVLSYQRSNEKPNWDSSFDDFRDTWFGIGLKHSFKLMSFKLKVHQGYPIHDLSGG